MITNQISTFSVDIQKLSKENFTKLKQELDFLDKNNFFCNYDVSDYGFWIVNCKEKEYWYCGAMSTLPEGNNINEDDLYNFECEIDSILSKYSLPHYGGTLENLCSYNYDSMLVS